MLKLRHEVEQCETLERELKKQHKHVFVVEKENKELM